MNIVGLFDLTIAQHTSADITFSGVLRTNQKLSSYSNFIVHEQLFTTSTYIVIQQLQIWI